MANCSSYNRILSALRDLKRQCPDSNWYQISGPVERLKSEIGYLKLFLECIHKLSDAPEVAPNLDSLSIKIQSAMEMIANQLEKVTALKLERAPKWTALLPGVGIGSKIELKSRQIWVAEVQDFIDFLIDNVELFKQVITDVYDSFTSNPPLMIRRFDYVQLEEFVYSVEALAWPLQALIRPFIEKLGWITSFLGRVADSFPNNPNIGDFITHVGSVAVHAALVLCRWWARGMEEDVMYTLLYLEQKIQFSNPELLSVNLSLLESFQTIADKESAATQVHKFVELLLEFPQPSLEDRLGLKLPFSFHDQLVSLIASASNFSEDDIENMRRFLTNVKVVDTKAEPLEHTLHRTVLEGTIGVLNLLAKILVMKLEIFLKEQVATGNIFLLSETEQIIALNQAFGYLVFEERLSSVRSHVEDEPDVAENIKLNLILLDKVAEAVASLKNDIRRKMVRNILFELLLEMVLFKSESFLVGLRENNEDSIILAKEGIKTFCKRLKFLIIFVRNHPEDNTDGEDKVFAHILAMTSREISLRYSFHINDVTEETIKDFVLFTSDLLAEIKLIMVELKDTYLHVPMFNFPKTNGLGFIDSLLEKLRELMKADVDASLKPQISEFLQELEFLTPFLRDVSEHDIEIPELKDLGARIIDVAYEVEYCIDSMMLEERPGWKDLLRLYHLREDIRVVKSQVSAVEDKTHHAKEQDIPHTSAQKEPKAITLRMGNDVVILNDQEEMIIDRLIAGPKHLDVVSIVGLPGIGKTTLASQVYNCPKVAFNFHVRTWCCVAQIYRKRDVLLETLSHITALTDDTLGMTNEDLEDKLRKLLLKNKFLIVMDDLWDTEALNDLRRSLPNDGNGSRILTTSRQDLKANSDAGPHHLRQLSHSESWNLLQKKIFREEHCPEGLVEIGEQIAKTCKGLPLAIVAVAGLLQKRERQYKSWKEIQKDLGIRIVDDPQENCRRILELSYKHLPDYLKSCFLYFGAFLEDQDIAARKLIQLWISEGLVQKSDLKSLEHVAEDYLTDLRDRSLVIFSRQRSRGGAKTCRVHDVLRNFCQSKAKEDNFLKVITKSNEAPLHDLNYIFNAKIGNPLRSTTYEDYRLCFCSQRKHFLKSKPSGPRARTLFFFANNDKDPRRPYDISVISHNFRLLKVLDLECINMGTIFPEGLKGLVLLRYLAVAGYIDYIPESIAELQNLETLVVRGLGDEVNLPEAIWCLKKLRHLQVTDIALINLQGDHHGDSSGLYSLVTVSSIFLRFCKETEYILRKISNLRKLKCIFSEPWDDTQDCNNFPSLEILNHLESLKITYYGQTLHSSEFSFPSNLKKLTLSNFRLPWDKISVIGKLPKLEVLKLLSEAFDGKSWDMVEGEFSELKYLKLDTLNIVEWNVCSDYLPKLQQLVLRCCEQLEEVPLDIAYIYTLENINVQWCGPRVEESVRKIKKEIDESLKVFINFAEVHASQT